MGEIEMRKYAAVLACLLAGGAAQAVTVDFEGLTNSFVITNSISSGGLTFTASTGQVGVIANGNICSPICPDSGSASFIFGSPATFPASVSPLVITGANAFSLSGLDYAELGPAGYGANSLSLTITGILAGGGSLSRQLEIDQIIDGPGGVNDFQRVMFDSVFAQGVFSSVEISGARADASTGGFSLDNLVVSFVPEPSSWSLMILGFGAVGAAMRRRRAIIRFA
jgi:hypothetical protein